MSTGPSLGLSVEIPQRVGEGVLHDRGQNFELLSFKTRLDQTPLCFPGFPLGGEKAFAQEVAHPLLLDLGFVIVLRVGLQHMLNDDGIGGDNGFFDAAKIEAESFAMEFGVLGKNLYGIAGHGARIQEGLGSGDGGYALRQGHASLSNAIQKRNMILVSQLFQEE